jgi:hypothetical protein
MLVVGGSVYLATPAGPGRLEADAGGPPPAPSEEPPPPPSPVVDASEADVDLGACCRAGSETECETARALPFSDGLTCHTCKTGEKRVLDPKREWSMWLQLLEDGPRIVPCARLGAREVCAGVTLGTQQSRGLRITIDDIQQGRLIFKLVAPQQVEPIPDLEGPARIGGGPGRSSLLSPALCEGAKLHVTVPDEAGPHDVAVKVYLVRPREDDVR